MDDRTAPTPAPGEPEAGDAGRTAAPRHASSTVPFVPGPPADEVRGTARLLVDIVHAMAAPAPGAERRSGSLHGAGGQGVRLSPQAIRAAVSIYEHGRLSVGGLASGIGVSVGWASRIVEELEASSYVVRERDPDDRRVVWVRLSPDAIADVEGAYRWRDDAVERALRGLEPTERAAVRTFLASLVDELAPESGT